MLGVSRSPVGCAVVLGSRTLGGSGSPARLRGSILPGSSLVGSLFRCSVLGFRFGALGLGLFPFPCWFSAFAPVLRPHEYGIRLRRVLGDWLIRPSSFVVRDRD